MKNKIKFNKELLKKCIKNRVRNIENSKYFYINNSQIVGKSNYTDVIVLTQHDYHYKYSVCLVDNKTISISTSYLNVHFADFYEMDKALSDYGELLKKQPDNEIEDLSLEQLDKEIGLEQLSIYDGEDMF